MSESPPSNRPERIRRLLRPAAIALLVTAVALIVLIASGAFDPKPKGAFLHTDYPGTLEQDRVGEQIVELEPPWPADSPPERFSVRLAATQVAGDLDSGYGLALAGKGGRLVVAVSPLGYVAVREEKAGGQTVDLIPWSTWPHVRMGEAANEIWLDVDGDGGRTVITASVNRETLWRGEKAWSPERVGLWSAGFGGRTEVDFRSLEWFAEPADQR
ncbi:MAG: hypothetical protein KBD86_09135 [Candidatus Promineofilum sp.]|nr:hypothetical protein [Promineifilum sp.]